MNPRSARACSEVEEDEPGRGGGADERGALEPEEETGDDGNPVVQDFVTCCLTVAASSPAA